MQGSKFVNQYRNPVRFSPLLWQERSITYTPHTYPLKRNISLFFAKGPKQQYPTTHCKENTTPRVAAHANFRDCVLQWV